MARERYGNGYKGRAATRRKMRANFRGFADHSPRSLKPVHGHVGHANRFAWPNRTERFGGRNERECCRASFVDRTDHPAQRRGDPRQHPP